MPKREVIVDLMAPKAVMVRVAQELLPALENWSEPVQVRIDRLSDGSYDMIARTHWCEGRDGHADQAG